MISHQQKGRKTAEVAKPGHIQVSTSGKKTYTAPDGTVMVIDPELDRFSGDEYLPEKHKEAEIRLANSTLPPFK